jgi:hypothetical protein
LFTSLDIFHHSVINILAHLKTKPNVYKKFL